MKIWQLSPQQAYARIEVIPLDARGGISNSDLQVFSEIVMAGIPSVNTMGAARETVTDFISSMRMNDGANLLVREIGDRGVAIVSFALWESAGHSEDIFRARMYQEMVSEAHRAGEDIPQEALRAIESVA